MRRWILHVVLALLVAFAASPTSIADEPAGMLSRDGTIVLEADGIPIEARLRGTIDRNSASFGGLSSDRFRVEYVARVPGKSGLRDMDYLLFVQTESGTDVVGGQIVFAVRNTPGGNVATYRAHLHPAIPEITPRLDVEAARDRTGRGARPRSVKSEFDFVGGKWRLLHRFADGEEFVRVDRRTGEVFTASAVVPIDVVGNVNGRVVLFNPISTGSNLVSVPFADLKASLTDGTGRYAHSNAVGNFSIGNSGSSPLGISATLLGKWANVIDAGGAPLLYNGTATPGTPVDIAFNPGGNAEASTAQANAYYHTTLVHNWLQNRGIVGTGIDIPLTANVNFAGNPGYAYYNLAGPSINFFLSGVSPAYCWGRNAINSAYDTVIYHEYGHFVDHKLGGIPDLRLSEGWGDLIAAYVSGQPWIGEGWCGPGTILRFADNNYVYNPADQQHTAGQAWAGFGWDLRNNLIFSQGDQNAGIALAENLVIPVLFANSVDIPTAVADTAVRDDDDGDLSNGSPHSWEIISAATRHGLGPVYPVSTYPTVRIVSPSADATVSGTVRVSANIFDDTQVTNVEFYLDGILLGSDTTSPYALDWQTGASGLHSLKVKVYDTAGRTAEQTINVTVVNLVSDPPGNRGLKMSHEMTAQFGLSVGECTPYTMEAVSVVGGNPAPLSSPSSVSLSVDRSPAGGSTVEVCLVEGKSYEVCWAGSADCWVFRFRTGRIHLLSGDAGSFFVEEPVASTESAPATLESASGGCGRMTEGGRTFLILVFLTICGVRRARKSTRELPLPGRFYA